MLDEIWIHSQAKKLGFNKFKKSNGDIQNPIPSLNIKITKIYKINRFWTRSKNY